MERLEDICNDVLRYGPLEPLLVRDDIADIMVNGATTTYIEVAGKVQKTSMRFADNAHHDYLPASSARSVGGSTSRARSVMRVSPTAAAST